MGFLLIPWYLPLDCSSKMEVSLVSNGLFNESPTKSSLYRREKQTPARRWPPLVSGEVSHCYRRRVLDTWRARVAEVTRGFF